MKNLITALLLCVSIPSFAQQPIEIGGKDQALFCYDFQTCVSFIYPPGQMWPITGTAFPFGLYANEGVKYGCIVSDIDGDTEPEWWAYFVGNSVEIHVNTQSAVYYSGHESDLLQVPKPFCYRALTQQHEIAIGVRSDVDFK